MKDNCVWKAKSSPKSYFLKYCVDMMRKVLLSFMIIFKFFHRILIQKTMHSYKSTLTLCSYPIIHILAQYMYAHKIIKKQAKAQNYAKEKIL